MMKHILVLANDQQREEWQQRTAVTNAVIEFAESSAVSFFDKHADVYFMLDHDILHPLSITTSKPVFVNAVIETLDKFPSNVIRINAWPGFLKSNIIEVVTSAENIAIVEEIMHAIEIDYRVVPDVPGMIAARTVSMIINEAYYALGEQVSSVEEIDTAMKLGTNYPYGPFEWADKIGLEKVYFLLKAMEKTSSHYTIAPAMENALINCETPKK